MRISPTERPSIETGPSTETGPSIEPGATIGILGGGQLGRMTALAAARLGYRCIILAPEDAPPAGDVAYRTIRAAYDDDAALDALAGACDVVTLEFENIPAAALDQIAEQCPVRPGSHVLTVTQDRLVEKQTLRDWGIPVAGFASLDGPDALQKLREEGWADGIIKTRRFGYDGKGQLRLNPKINANRAWRTIGAKPSIIERFVDFDAELSVIVARSPTGEIRCFPPVRNEHENHILRRTLAPMPLSAEAAARAVSIAATIAGNLALEGLLAVEMFLTKDGRILVNELAPRPHNSGHWTIEGAATSQFEQLVRAICDLPLGDTEPLAETTMVNLLGHEALDQWLEALRRPRTFLHLYGKAVAKPGRKMGHVTSLGKPLAG